MAQVKREEEALAMAVGVFLRRSHLRALHHAVRPHPADTHRDHSMRIDALFAQLDHRQAGAVHLNAVSPRIHHPDIQVP